MGEHAPQGSPRLSATDVAGSGVLAGALGVPPGLPPADMNLTLRRQLRETFGRS
jgi:hypothetical protein